VVEPIRSFDDLSVGQEFRFGTMSMPLDEVLDFARRWDPQPFHTDEAQAKESPYGGLIASGIHTLSAAFGHMIRTGFVERVSMGGPGLEVRWLQPVRPGDEIDIAGRVEELKPSRSRPDRGTVRFRYTGTRVADGAVVIEILATHIFRR
jgi:acyl dehydratase